MKVCFVYSNWPHDKTLDTYRKMTPGKSGKWKDMEAVTTIEEADFCVIIDNTYLNIPKAKRIYISAHPLGYPGNYISDTDECLASISYEHTSGFLEWWLDYDYDTLIAMEQPVKLRNAACILSNARSHDYQIERIDFMNRYCERHPNTVDLYGRMTPELFMRQDYKGELGTNTPDTYWYGKEILKDYKYAVEFDAYGKNYFSERLADALLMYCLPIYSGGWNLEEFLPTNSFRYLDRDNPDALAFMLKEDLWEFSIEDIKKARLKILNELQLWPKVYNTICSL